MDGASGRRLARLVGVSFEELCGRSLMKNVLAEYPGPAGAGGRGGKGDRFPMREARRAVEAFDPEGATYVVLLGALVAEAFGVVARPFEPLLFYGFSGSPCGAVLPHPSGVSRWWNDPVNELRAARFLREVWAGHSG